MGIPRTPGSQKDRRLTKKALRRMGPKVCIVYGLCGPDEVIRYIGQTRQHPFDRLKMHKQMARTRDKLPLHKWVNGLGDDLQMKALVPEATWDITEIILIDRYKLAGGELFNLTRGGEDTHIEMKRCAPHKLPW